MLHNWSFLWQSSLMRVAGRPRAMVLLLGWLTLFIAHLLPGRYTSSHGHGLHPWGTMAPPNHGC